MSEEISLHGKGIRKLQQRQFTSETARWGGECELESGQVKNNQASTLSYINVLPNKKERKHSLPLQLLRLLT